MLDVITLTAKDKPTADIDGSLTVTQWAAVVTFTPENWYQPVSVGLEADPWYLLAPGRENWKTFAKRPHILSGIRGPLAVEGGTTAADRSLRPAVLLPGEGNGPLFEIAEQPPEAQQVDVLNVYADSSQEDHEGWLTATAITGLGMNAVPLDFSDQLGTGETMPFGEPTSFPAGISYGAIVVDPATGLFDQTAAYTTIEVLNILLGEGNDTLHISGTLLPGPDTKADGTPGVVAVHGGITTVHGGGNWMLPSGVIGGDTIIITGGAGPNSPLVVYGDTSQDGLWYSGDPRVQSVRSFGTKPFPAEIGNGDSRFIFPVGNPFTNAGNDVIDASTLFAGVAAGDLPSVGFTAYGGAGDDTIIGSAAHDYLAGGSGNDTISGGRGSDQIYGDNGVNVDVITRELTIPWRNASVYANRDGLEAGADVLHGDAVGSTGATTDEYDDIVFGDYGHVRQDVASALVGIIGGTTDEPVYGYVNPAQLQKIETAGRVREITTQRAEDGANDTITGDGGRDRLFGGNGSDTISGQNQSNVIFGDHGRMLYLEGADSVTILHLAVSINEAQGAADRSRPASTTTSSWAARPATRSTPEPGRTSCSVTTAASRASRKTFWSTTGPSRARTVTVPTMTTRSRCCSSSKATSRSAASSAATM